MRFAGETLIDVYLTEESFYLSQNGRRFVFVPENAEEYTGWRNVWLETMFRAQGLPIHAAAWEALDAEDYELEPLKVPPEDEPREGIARRLGRRYLREMESCE